MQGLTLTPRLSMDGQARPPKDIKFTPLNKTQEYTAEEMMTLYKVRVLPLEPPRYLGADTPAFVCRRTSTSPSTFT